MMAQYTPEQSNIEYKTASGGKLPDDTWKTISAFSNSEGGSIYFGITHDGKHQKLSPAEIDQIQQNILTLSTGAFNIRIAPEIVVREDVVEAIFEPAQAQNRPVFRRKSGVLDGSYMRIGSSNVKVNEEILRRFAVAARGGAESLIFDGDYQTVFDRDKVAKYIALINEKHNHAYDNFSEKEILIKQKAINADGEINMLGMLIFSRDRELQDIVAPTMNIEITQYPGLTKVNDADYNEVYIDAKEFDGAVVDQFNGAFGYVKSKIPEKGAIKEGGLRKDRLAIPEVAIREALANAIAHRDYSTHSSRIQIDIYQDRIEIINPGMSLVPIKELDSTPPITRNPLLMNFLRENEITDQKGRGIRTIVAAIKDQDIIDPVFENLPQGFFRATLYNTSIFTDQDKEFINTIGVNINDRQKRAVAYARNNSEGINNSKYRLINSIQAVRDDKKAHQELNDLVDKGIFDKIGDGKGRRYVVKK